VHGLLTCAQACSDRTPSAPRAREAGKRLRKQQTLTEIEAQLDPARFVRIHRSFLLNVERLARIEPYAKDSWLAILQDGTRLPLSRAGYQRLRELIG
jgi:two-component system LytT family response regulator